MAAEFLKNLTELYPNSISEVQEASFSSVKFASVEVLVQVDVKFKINLNSKLTITMVKIVPKTFFDEQCCDWPPNCKRYNIEFSAGEKNF